MGASAHLRNSDPQRLFKALLARTKGTMTHPHDDASHRVDQLPEPVEGESQPLLPHIVVDIAPFITFATHQAAVPLVRSLRVLNPQETQSYEALRVELTCEPPVVLPQTWHVSRLRPGDEISVLSRNVKLDGGMLDRLNERMRADITIRLLDGDTVLNEQQHELVALARNEWGGASSMPELLAAFVLPNDPAVATLLAEASDLLRASGRPHSFEGYQSGTRERPWEVASAIWTAVANHRLIYTEPPASFERVGQKVRSPGMILESRLATCLDSAVLFAAALEQAGLHPLIGIVEGHALVGVWLRDATLPELITDDASLLRRYRGLEDLVLFETTFVCHDPPAPFGRALEAGTRHVREEVEDRFVYALDIKQARGRGIHPLPLLIDPLRTTAEVGAPTRDIALEAPPSLRPLEDPLDSDKPTTPEGRVEMWKRRLLDLTKRNRLLNLKPSKTAIRIICPDVGAIEDRLAADIKLGITPLEHLAGAEAGRDAAVFVQQNKTDYAEQFARRALERNQLVADLPKQDLTTGLVELYRKAATDLREGGANTLFLAIGTLRWRPTEKADGPLYRAPILLVPVKLERTSAAATPKLVRHPDETVVNMTLLEMLHQDFGIVIPELSGVLPTDESGVDVPTILRAVRRAIGDARGWSVEDEVILSTFSFAKYLMWKDLCDRTAELKRSSFVAHMIDTPHLAYQGNAEFLELRDLDERIHPGELFTPLQGDSSQIAAVHASGGHGDMVLEGPPGTGKSQTIANIIAQNLALGRRILFVAEKMTALSVVHDRLAKVGLGDFCLELHSNKATRRSVVDQLEKAWGTRTSRTETEWAREAERLMDVRQKLNGLVRALHDPAPSGISPRLAIAEACASSFNESVTLDWQRDLSMDRVTSPELLEQFEELATAMGGAFAQVEAEDRTTFAAIGHADWSNQWTASCVEVAVALESGLDEATQLATRVGSTLRLPLRTSSLRELQSLAELAAALVEATGPDAATYLSSDGEKQARMLEEACDALTRYRKAHESLPHAVGHEIVGSADHDSIVDEWGAATGAFVLTRFFKCRAVRKRAEATWRVHGVQDVGRLAEALSALRKLQEPLRRFDAECRAETGWRGLESDTSRLRTSIESGRRLRAATLQLAPDHETLSTVREAIGHALRNGYELLEVGAPGGDQLRRYITAHRALVEAYDRFAQVAGLRVVDDPMVESLRTTARGVIEHSSRLNAWCRWQRYREDADAAGLGALTRALEVGAVTPDRVSAAFRVAYCRWLAPLLIDSRPVLRAFSAIDHERLIARFRQLDETLAKIAAEEIRARLSRSVPHPGQPNEDPGFGILKRETQTRRSSRTVRSVLGEIGPVVGNLMPCYMMSPMSVAQFIPVDAAPFDLVIFDEASQITTWDAIGAIARGRHVIIVGDPKQMPPSNFFGRSADDEELAEEEGSEAIVADLESILDEALATGMRHRRLTGHYRSRHESLIAFSNHAYYGGELVTYPAAETRPSAVSLVRVSGTYQKGKERTNPIEAKAVVAEVSRRLRDPARRQHSIGVVTMNSEQQRLIRNLLDDERRRYPEIEVAFKGSDGEEEDMVYNLETVQGHDRDVVMISIGYGPAEPGGRTMSMNFGPLNKSGGERRLNVAVTRAREEVVVFASFGPEMIDLSRTKARAVEDLKHYMDFAERGPIALRQATHGGMGVDQFDSPLEEAVARALRQKGWEVRTQVGVSRFRVDLGIVHPDMPGRFLAGVECDGASYHSSATARDRDRIREGVLVDLGWTLVRLWSTDYFLDPTACLGRLHLQLTELLEQDRAKTQSVPQVEVPSESDYGAGETPKAPGQWTDAGADTEIQLAAPLAGSPTRFASLQPLAEEADPELPVLADDEPADPEDSEGTDGDGDKRFYDASYLPDLRQQCLEFIDRAGPMSMRYLAERTARAHGFARTGKTIRSRVWAAVGKARQMTKDPDQTRIVWPASVEPVRSMAYRGLSFADEPRSWDAVPHAERLGLALEIVRKHGAADGVAAMAAAIGFSRLKEKRRKELEALVLEASQLV